MMTHLPALANLARQIVIERDAAKAAARKALEHAIRCGELLIQAKDQCSHGSFETWAADNCGLSKSMYTAYMRLARRKMELPAMDLPIREAIKLLAEPKEQAEYLDYANVQRVALSPSSLRRRAELELALADVMEHEGIEGVVDVMREVAAVNGLRIPDDIRAANARVGTV